MKLKRIISAILLNLCAVPLVLADTVTAKEAESIKKESFALYSSEWEEWYNGINTFMDKVNILEDKITQILNEDDRNLQMAMMSNDYAGGERILEKIIDKFAAIIKEFKSLDAPEEFNRYVKENIKCQEYRKLYYEATLKRDRDLAFQYYNQAVRAKLKAIKESKRIFTLHNAPEEILHFANEEIRYYDSLLRGF